MEKVRVFWLEMSMSLSLFFFEVSRHAAVSTEGNTQLMPKEWVEGTMRYEGGCSFQILHLSKKDVGASAESLSCCHQWIVASASQKRLQRSDAVVSHRSGQYIYIRKWLIFLLKMLMLFFPERFWESTPEKIPVPIRWALSALSLKILKPKAILMKIPASKNPKQFLSTQMEGPGKDMDRNVKMFGGIFSFEVPKQNGGLTWCCSRSAWWKEHSNCQLKLFVDWLASGVTFIWLPLFSRR